MTKSKSARKRKQAGFTKRSFGARFGWGWSYVDKLVRTGEINSVTLGGKTIIPESEAPRMEALLGITPRESASVPGEFRVTATS